MLNIFNKNPIFCNYNLFISHLMGSRLAGITRSKAKQSPKYKIEKRQLTQVRKFQVYRMQLEQSPSIAVTSSLFVDSS